MEKITKYTTLAEINHLPEFAQAKDQLIGGGAEWFKGMPVQILWPDYMKSIPPGLWKI